MRRSVLTGSSACADDDDREAVDGSKPRHKSLRRHAPLQAGHPVIPGQRIEGKAVPNATFRAYWIVRNASLGRNPPENGYDSESQRAQTRIGSRTLFYFFTGSMRGR